MATQRDIRRLRSLKTGKGRREWGQYAAEGVRLLEESRRYEVEPEALYLDPGALSDRGRQLVAELEARGIPCEEIARHQLKAPRIRRHRRDSSLYSGSRTSLSIH